MSEKSFAVVSVTTAVICGVFFYPDPVARPAVSAAPASIAPASTLVVQQAAPIVKTNLPLDAAGFLPPKNELIPIASH